MKLGRFLMGAMALILLSAPAFSQTAVQQLGPVTPQHLGMWAANGSIMDAGGPARAGQAPANNLNAGTLPSGLSIVNSGLGYCAFNAYASAIYNSLCFGFDGTGNGLIEFTGDGKNLQCRVNGVTSPCFGSNMEMSASNATLPTARYNLGPNNACNPVTDFAADPTGATPAQTAINSCAAVTKNGKRVNVYLPEGVYYVTGPINLTSGQMLKCDARGTTIISVDQAFSASATGVIVGTRGGLDQGIEVRDCDITFAQPSDQGTRANFAALGVCTSGTGGTGCKYPPAIISAGTGAAAGGRTRIENVRISRAWDGISSGATNTVFWIENVEMSALNIGINFAGTGANGIKDFTKIAHFSFWNYDIDSSSALFTGVYSDGSTYAAKFAEVDGLSVVDFSTFRARISVNDAGFWGEFSNIMLDGNNSGMEIGANSGPGVILNNVYTTGTPNGTTNTNCQIDVKSTNVNTIIANWNARGPSSGAIPSLCVAGGLVKVSNSEFFQNALTDNMVTASGGTLEMVGNRFNGANGATLPLVSATNTHIQFVGNHFPVSGTNAGGLTVATDFADNYVADNNFVLWNASVPAGILGSYDLGDQALALTVTPSFATPGDSVLTVTTYAGAYYRRGDWVDFYFSQVFNTNAYTTAAGNFQQTLNTPVMAGGTNAHASCTVGNVELVTTAVPPMATILNATSVLLYGEIASNAAPVAWSTAQVPASKTGVKLRVSCRYRIR